MTEAFRKIDTSAWMLDLFKSIDELDTSERSGFRILADDLVMQFGPKTVHGLDASRKVFVALDAPFITKHLVAQVFQYERPPAILGDHDPFLTDWEEKVTTHGVPRHRPSEMAKRGLIGFLEGCGHENGMLGKA